MIQAIKLNLLINVGDFITLFPECILDGIRELNIYEVEIDPNSIYYFGKKDELDKLIEILDFCKVIDSKEDVTDLFHTNKLNLSEVELEFLNNEFLESNLNPNDILDKINFYGVGNLNPLDKKILATM
jgi:hypothetical protein